MMLQIRRSSERGMADHGWLKSKHTFSFAEYYDPQFKGFSVLRVINEDRIKGGTGFGRHPHQDMEIISYVIQGELKHQDSMGNSTVIKPGEVQRMSAGTGIEHSEFNGCLDQETHFLQIWIRPKQTGLIPSYGQKSFAHDLSTGKLVLVASQTGESGSVTLNQDAKLYILSAKQSGQTTIQLQISRNYWLQIVRGEVKANDQELAEGDGLGISQEQELQLTWATHAEFLFFDLP